MISVYKGRLNDSLMYSYGTYPVRNTTVLSMWGFTHKGLYSYMKINLYK